MDTQGYKLPQFLTDLRANKFPGWLELRVQRSRKTGDFLTIHSRMASVISPNTIKDRSTHFTA